MRLWIVMLVGFSTQASDLDGCRFVGSLFAKTISFCTEGFCSGFVRIDDRFFVPEYVGISQGPLDVTCEEAHAVAQSFLHSHAPHLEEDIFDYITDRAERLEESLWRLAVSDTPLPREALRLMSEIRTAMYAQAAADWSVWSDLAQDMENWMPDQFLGGMLGSLIERPFGTDLSIYNDFFFFLFDVAAIHPQVELGEWDSLGAVTLELYSRTPSYRDRFPQEYAYADVFDSARLVSAIQSGIADSSFSVFKYFQHLWSMPNDASRAMLMYMVDSRICPNLEEIVMSWISNPRTVGSSALARLGVTLASHCTATIPVHKLGQTSILLGQLFFLPETNDAILVEVVSETDSVALVMNSSLPWINGIRGTVATDVVSSLRDVFLGYFDPRILVGENQFRFGSRRELSQSEHMYGAGLLVVGRLIGLSLRYGMDLSTFQLHPSVMKMLFTPRRLVPTFRVLQELSIPESDVHELLMEPMYYVTAGISEVLGPAYLEIYVNVQFSSLFTS